MILFRKPDIYISITRFPGLSSGAVVWTFLDPVFGSVDDHAATTGHIPSTKIFSELSRLAMEDAWRYARQQWSQKDAQG